MVALCIHNVNRSIFVPCGAEPDKSTAESDLMSPVLFAKSLTNSMAVSEGCCCSISNGNNDNLKFS